MEWVNLTNVPRGEKSIFKPNHYFHAVCLLLWRSMTRPWRTLSLSEELKKTFLVLIIWIILIKILKKPRLIDIDEKPLLNKALCSERPLPGWWSQLVPSQHSQVQDNGYTFTLAALHCTSFTLVWFQFTCLAECKTLLLSTVKWGWRRDEVGG